MNNKEKVAKLMPFILVIYVMAGLMDSALSILSPTLTNTFDVSASMIAVHFAICGVIFAICDSIYGTISDFIPIRKIMIFAIVMFVGGAFLGIVLQFNFYLFVVARAIQNVGQAAIGAMYVVLVAKYLNEDLKIKYFAIFTACYQLTQAVGVLAGGLIATYLKWWMVFLIPMAVIFFIPALVKYLPTEEKSERTTIDFAGLGLFAVLVLSVNMYFGNMKMMWLFAAILFVIAFIIYISKNKNAFVTSEFFKNKNFVIALIIEFFVYAVQIPFPFLYSFIISGVYGKTEAVVSYVMLPAYLCAALVGTMFTDKLVKKFGKYKVLTTAMCLIIAALLGTELFLEKGIVALALTSVVFSLGYVLMYSPIVDTVFSTLHKNQVGRGLAFNGLMLNVSASIGIAAAGQLMVNPTINSLKLPHINNAALQPYAVILLIMIVVFLVGMSLYLINRKNFEKLQMEE